MDPADFERLKRQVALDLARRTLEGTDLTEDLDRLTEEQRSAYLWLEMLYYDGEITYGELWRLCRGRA